MKKSILFFVISVLFLNAAFSQKLTIKNLFGANYDEFGDYDLYNHSTETDVNGDEDSSDSFAIGDRVQADYESKPLDARLRLELLFNNSEAATFIIAPGGFIHWKPFSQFKLFAGTDFYKTFAIDSAYLAAADDTTKYGRLLTDSLGYETYAFGNASYSADGDESALDSGAYLYLNGFCGGISSDWKFGQDDSIYLSVAAGATMAYDSTFLYALDAGVNFGVKDLFDAGFTAHNITSDERKFGVFAGLSSIENLILNAGFYYNFTSSDYLPEARVTRSGADEFKKQKTKYALGLTGGYEFSKIGLGLYADVISGLNDEYIDEIKYYDDEENLIKTEVTTIKRGSTIVKYKDGKAKRTDGFTAGAVPFYTQFRVSYDPTDFFNLGFSFKLRTMLGDSSQTWISLFPNVTFELPSKLGSITTGVHLDMNQTRYKGLSDISIPLSYSYKFKKKF
ncbi:MAG: hypothetical protein K6A43_09400 [Treponema sp.]|nr:hypothetical protein [Treponema sp.]